MTLHRYRASSGAGVALLTPQHEGSTIMGTHTTVDTWTDTRGTWHARVTVHDSIVSSHFADIARAAIAGELRLIDHDADLTRLQVKQFDRRTSYRGELSGEYVESWADYCIDCAADGYRTLTTDTNADGEPLCEGCAARRTEDGG